MKSSRKGLSKKTELAVNILLACTMAVVFFGALEVYARYKYFGGSLRQKGFYSRGKTYTLKKTRPVYRIVCLGESTTHGTGMVADDQTYPAYLEEIINTTVGRQAVEVVNSGVCGKSIKFMRDLVKERIGDGEWDLMIVHGLFNHFVSFYPDHYNSKIDKIFVEGGEVKTVYNWGKMAVPEMLNIFLMEHSYFYTRLREKVLRIMRRDLNRYYADKGKAAYIGGRAENKTYPIRSERDRDSILQMFLVRYYRAVEEIVAASRAHGTEIILVIPPYPFFRGSDVDDEYFRFVFDKARRCLVRVAEIYGVPVVDTDRAFRERGRSADLFLDPVHLSPKGNRLLADIIASELLSSPIGSRIK